MANVWHINTTRRHIGSQQNIDIAFTETADRIVTAILRHFTLNPSTRDLGFLQLSTQVCETLTSFQKHDRTFSLLG
ncbi:Uncharacterised protein [Vibrio cholerae]|uniref:Uncharacterized protein n=1 Tax=Vibrio cholerae TaxID=666 RepID=A0A655SW13_VIBCL|nr:Uncharacterised protein [Vibrio cholerae]CSB27454.1 Uncharacterised protein [Vibrio cholerae]CSB64244.1 Uncharacterised protein [Vibrio cholerae]CSC12782.1 Uncharacterised protein [Vibrio cholerae]CSC85195.1 Uncharacterised protein [Vibrio cholerae]